MVRFIMCNAQNSRLQNHDLHSNMVRFIIFANKLKSTIKGIFTFQYG